MDSTFGKILQSKIFLFQIGPEKREFCVYSEAIAQLSPALNTLMTGEMIEAKLGHVHWEDIDEDTFCRFCEFAYFKDYTPPSALVIPRNSLLADGQEDNTLFVPPKRLKQKLPGRPAIAKNAKWYEEIEEPTPTPDEPAPTLEEEATKVLSLSLADLKTNPRQASRRDSRDCDLSGDDYPAPACQSKHKSRFKPKANNDVYENFSPVFLGHARLYILADKYLVHSLKQLVLHKLYKTLEHFTIFEDRVTDITELVTFVYEKTPDLGNGMDSLRRLVIRYVAAMHTGISGTDSFRTLLGEGGNLVIDLWDVLFTRS
jgi:hypothetical protein